MFVSQLEGRTILTIEGVAREDGGDGLSDIQEAFVDHGAVQCGFCTPGMILAASDLLRRNPQPDRVQIREAISGNLCRCTGYQKIVDSIEATSTARSRKKEE
jgi:carbon-monoxide dehydrogenase small subunit